MELHLLSEADVAAAGEVFSAAFFPSAVPTYVFPDPERRARLLPAFFTAMTRLAIRHGEAVALGTPPQAVALWFLPDRQPTTDDEAEAAGMGAFATLMDEGETQRFAAVTGHMDAAHGRVMDGPHFYLPLLAVASAHQGQGAGSVLMRHTLDQATAAGVPCYLDSVDERNLPFYERLGFRVAEAGVVLGCELRVWAMRYG
jgi:ribosomal protein S18 acetylase RimI-like enzyme